MKNYNIEQNEDGDYEFYNHGGLDLLLSEMEFKSLYYEMGKIMEEINKQNG